MSLIARTAGSTAALCKNRRIEVSKLVRQVHQDIAATDLVEHRGRVGAVQIPQPRMGHRLVRRVPLFAMATTANPMRSEAQQPGSRDDVGRVGVELSREPAPELHGHVGADLHAYHTGVLPGGQLSRDHSDDRTGERSMSSSPT